MDRVRESNHDQNGRGSDRDGVQHAVENRDVAQGPDGRDAHRERWDDDAAESPVGEVGDRRHDDERKWNHFEDIFEHQPTRLRLDMRRSGHPYLAVAGMLERDLVYPVVDAAVEQHLLGKVEQGHGKHGNPAVPRDEVAAIDRISDCAGSKLCQSLGIRRRVFVEGFDQEVVVLASNVECGRKARDVVDFVQGFDSFAQIGDATEPIRGEDVIRDERYEQSVGATEDVLHPLEEDTLRIASREHAVCGWVEQQPWGARPKVDHLGYGERADDRRQSEHEDGAFRDHAGEATRRPPVPGAHANCLR